MKKNEKINVTMIGQKRIPSREGGVEIVVEELSTRMVKRGCNVTCCNRRGNHVGGKEFNVKDMKEYRGIKIKNMITIDKKGLAAVTASFFSAVYSIFNKSNIVHFHAEGPCAMIWIPKMVGKRCIVTIHGLDHKREKWGNFASKYILFGEKMAVKYADEIIVLSNGVKDYFNEMYSRKTTLIPNGVVKPNKVSNEYIKERYGLEKEEYFLYLGRIVPEKGIHYLIEAFLNVNPSKKLVIAGGASDTSEYYNRLKNMAKERDDIIFTGFVEGEILKELYSNAYTYVLPSDLEGMPLSLLEAMSYGNCCLVSNISECTDVVEENAVTFEQGNVKDLGKKIQYLCSNEEKVKKFKEISCEFICDKYNWENIVKKTLDLYVGIK